MAIFELTLKGPLHLGEHLSIQKESTLDWFPSDSFFAAMVSSWAMEQLDVETRLNQYQQQEQPPLLISSLFPRAGKVRFYPAPPRLPEHSGLLGKGSKAARKVRWMSSGVLNTLVNGSTPAGRPENFIHSGAVWLTDDERQQITSFLDEEAGDIVIWKKGIVPRVAVDRSASASNLFHSGRVIYGEDCGLWFAARGKLAWVREALLDLQDRGIGGLRSTGHGHFSWKEIDEELPEPKSGWGMCLSRFAPASAQEIQNTLQASYSAYRLTVVGGWCQDDQGHAWRRRSVRMVEEGALLPSSARGRLVDVRPQNAAHWQGPSRPVIRCGLAFMIKAGKLVEAA